MSSHRVAPGIPALTPTGPVSFAQLAVSHNGWLKKRGEDEEYMSKDEYDEFKSMLDSFKPPYKRRRKGAPRTTTRTRVRRDGNKGKSTITTRSRPGKKMDKKSAVNDHAKMENLKEAAAATERGVLSPVLLQRAMEKQSDAWSDAINAVNEAMAGRGGSSPPPTLGSRVGAGVDTAVDTLSDYWNRYVNAMKGGTVKDRLSDPGQARINQMLALTGTGALGGGVLGMLNEARKKEEDRDVLGGGFGGGVLGGLGGLGISAYGPNRLAKQTGLADHIKRPDWW